MQSGVHTYTIYIYIKYLMYSPVSPNQPSPSDTLLHPNIGWSVIKGHHISACQLLCRVTLISSINKCGGWSLEDCSGYQSPATLLRDNGDRDYQSTHLDQWSIYPTLNWVMGSSGTHFIYGFFPILIQIWWKIGFNVIPL